MEQDVLRLLAKPGERVAMDPTDLGYVSSAGLRVVLMAAKRAKKSAGTLILCGLPSEVRSVFTLSTSSARTHSIDQRTRLRHSFAGTIESGDAACDPCG